MNVALLFPIAVGAATIIQAGLNKSISQHLGIAHMTMLGNLFVFLYAVVFYFIVKTFPNAFPDFFQVKVSLTEFKLWYALPALCGLMIVAGLPYAFYKVGAVNGTIIMIASQVATGVLWDLFVEKRPVKTLQMVAMALAMASVGIATFS